MTDEAYEDDEHDGIFITLRLESKIIRVVDDTLIPSKIAIRADVSPLEAATQATLQAVMIKLRYWFEQVVPRCIAFSPDNDAAMNLFIDEEGCNRTANLFMLTPGDPTDELLAALFQAKFTALAEGALAFDFVEVTSDNQLNLSFSFAGNGLRILPAMDDWIGTRTYFASPWWARSDGSTLDVVPPADADLTQRPAWAFTLDTLVPAREETGTVLRPEFRPTVIKGGRDPGGDEDGQ